MCSKDVVFFLFVNNFEWLKGFYNAVRLWNEILYNLQFRD